MTNLKIYTQKLRESGLRPTRQRLKICEVLFSPEKTFHFTINDLTKIIEDKLSEKISLATVYNTCLLYTSPSPRDGLLSRMPSSA